ncbi:MAG: DNA polymerase III subunit gamma/tau [Christensenellaceae bacterium]|jgi:DNA polymerase-3 subunit gamma/tau|nr:DNA polymerase III subunit gamma/tau [Christensenellaceae bacterium]
MTKMTNAKINSTLNTTPNANANIKSFIKSLYRLYRPKSFGEVVGQEYVTKTLINQIANDKIGHAYLFCGTRGTGKTSVAKIFADAINCQNFTDGKVCGQCEWCKNPNKSMDVIEIDAASNNGVEPVRDLIDAVKYPPVVGRYKVYIIDEVHMFSNNAFNALLKTLEEPPPHIVFILATTTPQKLLPTVQSRCLRFDFRNVTVADIVKVIKSIFAKEKISADEDAMEEIAREGNGSVRDALSFADMVTQYCADEKITVAAINKITGAVNEMVLKNLVAAIVNKEIAQITKLCGEIFDKCNNTNRVLADYLRVLKNAYIATPTDKIANALKIFMDLEMNIKNSVNGAEHFETAALVASAYGG